MKEEKEKKNLRLVHVSDTHGARFHDELVIPECDVLIHSGDIGGRTGADELEEFLRWFEQQPAKKKIFIAGNHDIILDRKFLNDRAGSLISEQGAKELIAKADALLAKYSNIVYLNDTDYVYEGVKFYGSPITPSFHRQNWAFNADRGEEIKRYWAKIPGDVNVLITHGPPYGILDLIPESFKAHATEDVHRGCDDLLQVMKSRLNSLKLHCFGHIHEGPTGIVTKYITGKKLITFSNGAIISNDYRLVVKSPPILNIEFN